MIFKKMLKFLTTEELRSLRAYSRNLGVGGADADADTVDVPFSNEMSQTTCQK